MRLVYFGTPAVALAPLDALARDHDVLLVVTQPDRKRGRGGALVPSPVKQRALDLGLPVATPERASDVTEYVRELRPDVAVVVAFGQLIKPDLLQVPEYGFVNVHYSLLPRWRGAAPVERALLAGDTETGVCIMAMDEGLDTGAVYARASVAIAPADTAGDVFAQLESVGVNLLLDVVGSIGARVPMPQTGEATYARKLTAAEFQLDWTCSAVELDRVVRAGNPRPGARTTVNGRPLKVWQAHLDGVERFGLGTEPGTLVDNRVITGGGALVLDEVQPEGKPRMPFSAWSAGRRDVTQLGT